MRDIEFERARFVMWRERNPGAGAWEVWQAAISSAATTAALHSQYPATTEFDRGYDKAREDAAAAIRRRLTTRPAARSNDAESAAPTLSECSERIHDAIAKGDPLAQGIALGLASFARGTKP